MPGHTDGPPPGQARPHDRAVQARHDSLFSWGTFTVNLVGCLILGALTGAGTALPSPVLALADTGFCGALTI